MGKRLAFGTSGLRGAMGPGFCRINDLVVIQVIPPRGDDHNPQGDLLVMAVLMVIMVTVLAIVMVMISMVILVMSTMT